MPSPQRHSVFVSAQLSFGFEHGDPDQPGILPTFGLGFSLPIFDRNRGEIAASPRRRRRKAQAELALAQVEARNRDRARDSRARERARAGRPRSTADRQRESRRVDVAHGVPGRGGVAAERSRSAADRARRSRRSTSTISRPRGSRRRNYVYCPSHPPRSSHETSISRGGRRRSCRVRAGNRAGERLQVQRQRRRTDAEVNRSSPRKRSS